MHIFIRYVKRPLNTQKNIELVNIFSAAHRDKAEINHRLISILRLINHSNGSLIGPHDEASTTKTFMFVHVN